MSEDDGHSDQEKRRDARFKRKQTLWAEGQSQMETRDMSRSGMFIMAEDAHEVGEQFTVSFDDAEEGKIELSAEVMWRGGKGDGDKVGMGVKIVSFKQGEDAYSRFVQRHLNKEEDDDASTESETEDGGDAEK